MRILSIQEAYERKFKRQKRIKELKYHAQGTCAHIGKLSPGCISCFKSDPFRRNIYTGVKCNLNCVYCQGEKDEKEWKEKRIRLYKKMLLEDSKKPNYSPTTFSFTGGGEPLLYIDAISKHIKLIRRLSRHLKRKPWLYLYTNGVLADKEMLLKLEDFGIDEIRFHLGAANFSKKVYQHMQMAVMCFKAITVETPAWPPHRKQLFKMLPIIEDMGIKHLNIGEIEINKYNYKHILKAIPEAEIYPCYEGHLDDGGLVYDIIEEVLRKKYSYSVLDCNCFVKLIQRGQAKWLCYWDVENLI